jgi:phospholipid/cholesterol/gamma-HCH transport system substrate-binding protein
MRIDPRDSARVQVVVDIDSTTPVSEHTVAQLQLQGVTGLLYIDLKEDRDHKKAAPEIESLKYPVIRSAPSDFDVLLSSLPELVSGANQAVIRANRLFDDTNLAAVQSALASLDKASRGLPQTAHDLSSLVGELRAATAQLSASAQTAHGVIDTVRPDVEQAMQRLHAVSDHLAVASDQLDLILEENRSDIRAFTRDGLPEIERFVREGRAAAEDIQALSNSLRENPAQLLYEPPQRGVEIPR